MAPGESRITSSWPRVTKPTSIVTVSSARQFEARCKQSAALRFLAVASNLPFPAFILWESLQAGALARSSISFLGHTSLAPKSSAPFDYRNAFRGTDFQPVLLRSTNWIALVIAEGLSLTQSPPYLCC